MSLSLRINDFLSGLFLGIGMRLLDLKVQFGRLWEDEQMRIVLADEVCPDSCRLWDIRSNQRLGRDRSHTDFGELANAYQEVARRLGILPESGPADLKGPDTVQ
jgi:phosphoribosylaminoimidazole-succinocarboxamide synthase